MYVRVMLSISDLSHAHLDVWRMAATWTLRCDWPAGYAEGHAWARRSRIGFGDKGIRNQAFVEGSRLFVEIICNCIRFEFVLNRGFSHLNGGEMN
jgi:hypothetical protein